MTALFDEPTKSQSLASETAKSASMDGENLTRLTADMMRLVTLRSQEAASQERARIVSWAHKHPDMPLRLAVRFIEMGEYTK